MRLSGGQPAMEALTAGGVVRSEGAVEGWLLVKYDKSAHGKPAEEPVGADAKVAYRG